MIDILLIAIVGVVTWCVASEGAWGAALTLLSVIFAGLLAMSFFEPLANFLQQNVGSSVEWAHRWDMIALIGLFAALVFGLRTATDHLMLVDLQVHGLAYDVSRWAFGALTGYVTMALLLTSLHTAPLPREFLGFKPERGNLLGLAPDRQWLGFNQYVSEKAFNRGANGPIFDGPKFSAYAGGEMKVWPSFPIRYASRRERYAMGGGAVTTQTPPAQSAPPQPGRPSRSPTQGF